MYIRPQMRPFSMEEESIIAASGFVRPETGEIPIDPNEKHDPSDALTKEDAFGFEW